MADTARAVLANSGQTADKIEQAVLSRQMEAIFLPVSSSARSAVYSADKSARFAHYTSAEAALSIIRTRKLWMRNITSMADYKEGAYGYDLLRDWFFSNDNKAKFIAALDEVSSGVALEAINVFDEWLQDTRSNTYISSISLHQESEDIHGRLSMWRAFGGATARVALVFTIPPFLAAADELNLVFSPVTYSAAGQVRLHLDAVIDNVAANAAFLRSVDRAVLIAWVFQLCIACVTCVKHPGFHEELEWRSIYSPGRFPNELMRAGIEVVGGIPQRVFSIPLDGSASDLKFSKLFERVIIGPSPYPWILYDAFRDVLAEAGVENAGERVIVSDIPIRV
jgi:hypothetical protein